MPCLMFQFQDCQLCTCTTCGIPTDCSSAGVSAACHSTNSQHVHVISMGETYSMRQQRSPGLRPWSRGTEGYPDAHRPGVRVRQRLEPRMCQHFDVKMGHICDPLSQVTIYFADRRGPFAAIHFQVIDICTSLEPLKLGEAEQQLPGRTQRIRVQLNGTPNLNSSQLIPSTPQPDNPGFSVSQTIEALWICRFADLELILFVSAFTQIPRMS
ncbi:hypothetical protein B0H67DRAFT_370999 [Lasiosphaeris hirsuta]|uniref:Uncharacterized protein n=1 Tax=Lasiosphaeris hirsuta TaxID=260670 RepID=A0AA40DMB6_9PEZI|nr:hypothetical protein B0H67DRAFT_370999 [Lasiosphaeris hirsuta]